MESAAFVVCDALGLDASGYSFPYVARWANGSIDNVKETADRVVECARQILAGLRVEDADEVTLVS